MIINEN